MTNRVNKPDTQADIELRNILDDNASTGFVMVSGAGSGKTTSIIKALNHIRSTRGPQMRQRSKKIACITYTEIAVNEIWSEVGNDPLFHVSTIHSFLWSVLKFFQRDIAIWVSCRIDQKIIDTQKKIAGFTTRTQSKTRLLAASDIERYQEQQHKIKTIQRFTYGVGSNYSKGVLGHDDVIKLSTELIRKYPLIAKVIGQKFPFLFVDESQDTAPNVVEAFKAISEVLGPKFCLGFIGDPMQKIYTAGVGAIIPSNGWKTIGKKENFRCPLSVLKIINKIRTGIDDLTQKGGKTELIGGERKLVQGTAKLLIAPRGNNVGQLNAIRQWLSVQLEDPLWLSDEPTADVKVLVIAHRMAANNLGFGSLYEAFHDKTSEGLKSRFDEGSHWSIQPILKLLIPLVLAKKDDDQFAVMNLLRRFAPSLQRDYVRTNTLPNILKDLHNRVTYIAEACGEKSNIKIFEVFKHFRDGRMFKLDDRLLNAMAEYNPSIPITEHGNEAALQKLLHTPVNELWAYRTYLEKQSPFRTHQGVKGAEFSRVLIVIDDLEGRHNQFSYGKLFSVIPPSGTDELNLLEGKETTHERTRRLLYVCCSRASKALAVVFFADDPDAAHTAIINTKLFPSKDVHNLINLPSLTKTQCISEK